MKRKNSLIIINGIIMIKQIMKIIPLKNSHKTVKQPKIKFTKTSIFIYYLLNQITCVKSFLYSSSSKSEGHAITLLFAFSVA